MDRTHLENFRLKCEEVLSQFKKKRRDNFVKYGDTRYDEHISRLLSLTSHIDDEIRSIDTYEDTQIVNNLLGEYDTFQDMHDKLIQSLKCEFENIDKQTWYDEHFDNWSTMPERQDCEMYSLPQRLCYSECRRKIFDHLERDWKRKTFPTLADRLEFF